MIPFKQFYFICNRCNKPKEGTYPGLCNNCHKFNTVDIAKLSYEGKIYLITNDEPKTNDLVLTNNYGVWRFNEKPSPLPYWCNKDTCKKLVLCQD